MDPEDIGRRLDELEMTPMPLDRIPTATTRYATHKGLLEIPGMPCIRVYTLNTGERVMDAADVEGFFARLRTEDDSENS